MANFADTVLAQQQDTNNADVRLYAPALFDTVLEAAQGNDSEDALGNIWNAGITEAASASDAVSELDVEISSITEAASATDTSSELWIGNPSLTESASGADSPSAMATFVPSITESASASDTLSGLWFGIPGIIETANGGDSENTGANVWYGNITESANATDVPFESDIELSSVIEAGAATDSPSVSIVTLAAIADPALAVDLASAIHGYNVGLVDATIAGDVLSNHFIGAPTVTEVLAAMDASDQHYQAPIAGTAVVSDFELQSASTQIILLTSFNVSAQVSINQLYNATVIAYRIEV